ncbi:unnamed protein product [Gordionus sp. m RMFG-2023]
MKRTRDRETLQNLLGTQNKNTFILASDDIPTISRELNLILTPLQIINPVLTSFTNCTDGDLSVINERKRWQGVDPNLDSSANNKPCFISSL